MDILEHPEIQSCITDIIIKGFDPKECDDEGKTLLMNSSSPEVTLIAIYLGCDVNQKDYRGNTALHYANSIEMVQILLDHGADMESHGEYFHTPIQIFRKSSGGYKDKRAEFLLRKGAEDLKPFDAPVTDFSLLYSAIKNSIQKQ